MKKKEVQLSEGYWHVGDIGYGYLYRVSRRVDVETALSIKETEVWDQDTTREKAIRIGKINSK